MRGLYPRPRMLTYGLGHDRRIPRKLGVSESHDCIARDTKPPVPHGVARLVQIMHPAIQFDDQPDLMTGEVGDRASNRRLPPEL